MHIDRVSRYVPVVGGSHSTAEQRRLVLMSLPRVRWLERDGDYKPRGNGITPTQYEFPNLSPYESLALGYKMSGLTNWQVAAEMGVSGKTARDYILQAVRKLEAAGKNPMEFQAALD